MRFYTDYIHQDGVNTARETTVSFSKSTIISISP